MPPFSYRLSAISIHAPTRGATIMTVIAIPVYLFQSTLPQGERRFSLKKEVCSMEISIHAPTRGATSFVLDMTSDIYISIHAPTRGATSYRTDFGVTAVFQSTLPQGERLGWLGAVAKISSFQSTLPQGERRGTSDMIRTGGWISIHAPTRGATL